MSNENIKTWPEKVKLFNCGHGFLEQYQNGDDESYAQLYIRADIAKKREKMLIAESHWVSTMKLCADWNELEYNLGLTRSDIEKIYTQCGFKELE